MSPLDRSLLRKYLEDKCTPEEENAVHQWFDLNNAAEYPGALSEKGYGHKEQKIWKRLAGSLEGLRPLSGRRKPANKMLFRYAAAAAILLCSTWLFNEFTGGALWWKGQRYGTGYGETKRVSLADGSIITLNAASELKVPGNYGKQTRELYLEGEAYFEVKKDTSRVFIVYSGNISTTALGTVFNVSAYTGDGKTIVSLREGKVAVKRTGKEEENMPALMLIPGEEVMYSGNGKMIKSGFNRKERLSWKSQVLYFRDAGLKEVINKLERHYGVKFEYESLQNVQWNLTGEYRQQSLRDILESLSFNYGIRYEINGNHVRLQK